MTEQNKPDNHPQSPHHLDPEGSTKPHPGSDDQPATSAGAEEGVGGGWTERSEVQPQPDLSGDSRRSSGADRDRELEEELRHLARVHRRGPRRRVKASTGTTRASFTPRQRLLLLDTWLRSKLPAKDFGALVGVGKHTLYKWKRSFRDEGPAGLDDRPHPKPGTRLTDEVKRAILMLKEAHPDWGQDRISAVLARTEAFGVSPATVGRFLDESGYQVQEAPTRPHPDKVRRFERARPNQMWQTDLFTFMLKRENRRVHLVAYMDDHSRFIVAFGLHASASGAMVREVFEAGIVNFGPPEEVLTDNGTQYHTWRGVSAFRKFCDRRGIKQILARPRHPQTLGKVERFWGTLWREMLQGAIFRGIEDARGRIGHFIDHYNFQRLHQGIDNLVPADRYFGAATEVKETLQARVAAKALELARHGEPRKPFYLTGRVGNSSLSLHAEGDRVVMTREGGEREEVDLSAPGRREDCPSGKKQEPPLAMDAAPADPPQCNDDSKVRPPGSSPLDEGLKRMAEGLQTDKPVNGQDHETGESAADDQDEVTP